MDISHTSSLRERSNFPLQDSRHYHAVIVEAVERVARSGQTILADGVRAFEEEFARWLGGELSGQDCIGVGNGTDALELALRSAGVQPSEGVIVPSLTAYATVAAILRVGAQPVFADVEAGGAVISVAEVERLLSLGGDCPRIRAVIAVHLYGEACDLQALRSICSKHGVVLIEDCAQATGTTYQGTAVGTWGDYAAFSFYPTKNLAALGDGGMLVVGSQTEGSLRESARRMRFYGWDESRQAVQFGVNSRLDEVQAWILKGKLADLSQQIVKRRKIAELYDHLIRPWGSEFGIHLPEENSHWSHSYHLYVITVDPKLRDKIVAEGLAAGIPYSIHYSLACHQHPYIAKDPRFADLDLPESERMSASVLSLPLNPYLTDDDATAVSNHLKATVESLQLSEQRR